MPKIKNGRQRNYRTEADYRAHVRTQTLNGMINMPDGQWVDNRKARACPDGVAQQVEAGTTGKKWKLEHKKVKK